MEERAANPLLDELDRLSSAEPISRHRRLRDPFRPLHSGPQSFGNKLRYTGRVDTAVGVVARDNKGAARPSALLIRQNTDRPVPGVLLLPSSPISRDVEHSAMLPIEGAARFGILYGEVRVLSRPFDRKGLLIAVLDRF